jgi:hypothetical protein
MSFDKVCPSAMRGFAKASGTLVPTSFLTPVPASPLSTTQAYTADATNLPMTLTAASPGLYDPAALTTKPTYTVGGITKTVELFSVSKLLMTTTSGTYTAPTPATRYDYTAPGTTATSYWRASDSTRLTNAQLVNFYNLLTRTDDPGSTTTPKKKMITPDLDLSTSLSTTTPATNPNAGNSAAGENAISQSLLFSLQYEFCFWAQVYKNVLKDLIAVQAASSVTTNTAVETTIVNLLNAINLRILDLTDIANHIATHVNAQISQNNADVASLLASISSNTTLLQTQGAELSSADANAKLRSRMVEYTVEKNNYANQLLGVYGFANLIALGLLFYIYRS